MIPGYARSFTYQIPWKSSSVHAGDHRGTQRGLGFEYRGNVPLVDYPDARRMDLRQTLRDPYEQVQVKLFNQDNITPIFAVCDLSSSMQFKGRQRKLDQAKEIAASIALSAFNAGDVFSLIGYNQHVIDEFTLPLSLHVHQALELIDELHGYSKMRVGSEGIMEVHQFLSQHKGLVFWISDFHMPLALIEQAFNSMSIHQIIPVVLWDDQEYSHLPRFGFGNMIDPETGQNRTIFFRETLKLQFEAAFSQRKQKLDDLFSQFDCQPLYLSGQFDPEAMSHYFEQYMSL
jgi:uncharacterized protein (DUF58 family)